MTAATTLGLTGAQTGVWYAQRLDPGSSVFNVGQYVDLVGSIDETLLERALRETVAEADALHVRFEEDGDLPVQRLPTARPDWPLMRLDVSAEPDPMAAAVRLLHDDMRQPVDPAEEALFRLGLCRVAPDRTLLYLKVHHLVLDAYGVWLLVRRVAHVYGTLVRGATPSARRFGRLADVVAEETTYRHSPECAEDRAFWAAQERGAAEVVTLSGAVHRPSAGFLRARGELDPSATAHLGALARATGSTWGEVSIAAFAAYVGRLAGADEVQLALPAMSRLNSVSLNVPSMVVNVLPLRLDVRPRRTAGELVTDVVRDVKRLRHHQRYRFEDIRRDAGLVGEPAGGLWPMVNIKPFGDDIDFGGVRGTVRNIAAGPVDDVTLSVYHDARLAALRYELDGNPLGFDEHTLGDRAEELGVALASFGRLEPDTRVARTELLPAAARATVVEHFNDTAAEVDGSHLLRRFDDAVAAHPAAVAVVAGQQSLTYAGLSAQVDRLAAALRQRGVGPGSLVGVAVPRTTALPVALLATVATGAAYLPLDLDFPAARISLMLDDAGPVCVLAAPSTVPLLPDGAPVLLIDDGTGAPPGGLARHRADVHADDPAYVMYTSGSTGRPKGVVVPHGALSAFLDTMAHDLALQAGDRLVAVTTISFDIAALELFVPLVSGACVVLADRDTVRDPVALSRLVETCRPRVVQATPSLWQGLLDEAVPGCLDGVHALVGGEAVPAALAHRLAGEARRATNVYGPTEVTVWATATDLVPADVAPSIGRPFPNTRAYVLDGTLQPVAPGVAGELYLAGVQLAHGYLGRVGLTSERFVADPHGRPGERMYRTGDVARWTADGRLEFLGRADFQVKLRGHRIELGEVEDALAAAAGAARAVVVVRESGTGSKQLVGYVVGVDVDVDAVRETMAARLPDYMLPAAVVALETLPLTSNGKVDRLALPAPAPVPTGDGGAPRGGREEALAGIFCDVLAIDAVGRDENFFVIGGHSLLATKLASRVRAELGRPTTVRDVFEAPTVATLTRRVAEVQGPARPPVQAGQRGATVPASAAQQRLWLLDQLDSRSDTYSIPFALRLSGSVDVARLRDAVAQVVARHESLRTVLEMREETLVQRVLPPEPPVPFEWVAVTAATLAGRVDEELARRFDLAGDLPIRVRLLSSAEDDHLLLVVVHHVAGDEWSRDPLLADLDAAYHGLDRAALPVQYADYSRWFAGVLGDTGDPASLAARQLDFWSSTLAGAPEEQQLITDRPRPDLPSGQGAVATLALDTVVAESLTRLSRRTGTTMFMVLHAAVVALLARHGAGDDIVVGTPVTGRGEPELDDLVGFFVNSLALRAPVRLEDTFTDLLAEVRRVDLAAVDHSDVPFDAIVERLNPRRVLGRNPLFQTMVAFDADDAARGELLGVPAEQVEVAYDVAKLDLDVLLRRTPEGLVGEVRYATELFDAPTGEALAARLAALLRAVAADPDVRLRDLDLLTGDDLARLDSWQGQVAAPRAPTAPAVLADTIARHPHERAVVCGREAITFAELGERVRRLAGALRVAGVRADRAVAVAVPRSVDAVVAALAVLAAGGVYVPLDLDLPRSRVDLMLRDTDPVCVLVTPVTADLVADGIRVLDVTSVPAGHVPVDLPPVDPRQGAYVIFTSGSTGRPKGVVVDHAGLAHLFADHHADLHRTTSSRLGRRVRALHTASLSFDSSFEQLLWLMSGHELHVLDEYDRRDPATVVGYVRDHQIDALDVTPSFADLLLEDDLLGGPTGRAATAWCPTVLLLGGEAVPTRLWTELRATRRPGLEVVNYYGPTEFSVDALVARVHESAAPVVGRPLTGCAAYVLDERLRRCPPGVPGELYLAGVQIARGYLRQGGLTSQRFVADPFGAPGTRMYRTGDRARSRVDGLEFLGRVDDQVKFRGFRVELGEVESALRRLDGVASAAALVRRVASGAEVLAGFVTGEPGAVLDSGEVRRALAARLPDYLVPGVVTVLGSMPTTITGKIDRTRLPEPLSASDAYLDDTAPETPTEAALAELAADLLGRPAVGVHGDFFALGGHSLLAATLVNRVRARLGVSLSVRRVFESPTVRGLAEAVDRAQPRSGDAGGRERPVLGTRDPAPLGLSAAQQRLWFLDRLDGPGSAYTVPLVLRLDGVPDVDALRAAVTWLVERHDVLRTVYVETDDGVPRPAVLDAADDRVGGDRLVHEVDASASPEALAAAARTALGHVFDLGKDAPLRVTLVRGGTASVLVVLTHHIASDEWSHTPLLADLDAAYAAHRAGTTPDRPPLALQYADYAQWHDELLGTGPGSLREEQLDFWRRTLAGVAEESMIDADRDRPVEPSGRGGFLTVELPPATADRLRRLATRHGATLFMALHAAVAAVLHRLGSGTDVALGTPVAGRVDALLDDLVGFFVNTIVLRTDLGGDPSYLELLGRVRATDLAALERADVPFDSVVEAVNPRRRPGRHPLFQAMIGFQSKESSDRELFGLSTTEQLPDFDAAKFELDITFVEERDRGRVLTGISYATDRFDEQTVRALGERIVDLVGQVVSDPTRTVASLRVEPVTREPRRAPAGTPAPRPAPGKRPTAAASAMEPVLCGLLAEVLGRRSVAPDDDFFALGGHSLLAARLTARVRRTLGVHVTLRDLFEATTMAALAARLATRAESAAAPPLVARPRTSPLPLSPGQLRMWSAEQLTGASTAYCIPIGVALDGYVDAERVREAVASVVRRHEVLRTVYVQDETGTPHQVVLDVTDPRLTGERLCALVRPADEPSDPADLENAAAGTSSGIFDLAVDPPLRAALVTAPGWARLVLHLHHIAADESSVGILLEDLDRAYQGHDDPALPVHYADYARWQLDLLAAGEPPLRESWLAYWRDALAGLPDELALPRDRDRPETVSTRGGVVTFDVGAGTSAALADLAARHGVTLFVVLHAAVVALLHRVGAGRDVVVGTPVSGRGEPEIERLVGFFLNTVVLRTRVVGDPSFTRLVQEVGAGDRDAFAHADLPFEEVAAAIGGERVPGRHPVFQTMLTFHSESSGRDRLFDVPAHELDVELDSAKFDLEIGLGRADAGISGGLRYSSDLFDERTVTALATTFVSLLDSVAAAPEEPLSSLDLRPVADRVLVERANATVTGVPDITLAELLEQGAARAVGPALLCGGASLSRAGFDERVHRLARHLVSVGAGPDRVVGIAVPRGFDQLVATHAVIQAGAAYLPLDAGLPADRLAHMADRARPVAVLTTLADRELFADRNPIPVDEPALTDVLAGYRATALDDSDRLAPLDADHLAYVLFTSGSTGRPKGVGVSHRSIVNRLLWMQHAYALGPTDRVIHKTPTTFDVSVWELFWPLAHGVPLVVAEPDLHRDPVRLAALMRREAVSVVHFVPSMLALFLELTDLADVPSLRLVVSSGEALTAATAAAFHDSSAGAVSLANLYGPTEAAVDVTAAGCEPGSDAGRPVSIGSPVWNTRTLVLDAELRELPVGVAGELYLAGVQLARSYVDEPRLTAERFVADPTAGASTGARMYRTGDLVRWRADGQLDYLGRTDDQVKVNGQRVELGEIETVLADSDDVGRAIVQVVVSSSGGQRLVGHLVPALGATVDLGAADERARRRLPAYMHPAGLAVLDEVPLSRNGKLDREALPDPVLAASVPVPVPVPGTVTSPAPDSGPAGVLAAVMAGVLGLDDVGPEDSFFSLGGDSISAIRVVAQARTAGLDIRAGQMFSAPTPARLALLAVPVGRVVSTRSGVDPVGPLVLPPVAHWLAAHATDRVPALVQGRLLTSPRDLDARVLRGAVQALLDHHDGLRQRVTVLAPRVWAAQVEPRGTVQADEVVRVVTPSADTDLPALLAEEARAARERLDPTAGVDLQVVHLDLGPGRPGRLLLVAHHLVVDEVSWQVLVPDLAAACAALRAGDAPRLDPVPTPLREWTRRLGEAAHDRRHLATLPHWVSASQAGSLQLADGPLDPAVDTAGTARRHVLRLPVERTEPLLGPVPAACQGTVNDVLLAALALAAASYAGATDEVAVSLDLEGHGREPLGLDDEVDLTRTVGWLTSLYPVRLAVGQFSTRDALAGGEDAGRLLKEVKEILRDVPDKGVTAGVLAHLNPATAATMARLPGAEILWNYLGRPAAQRDGDWHPAPERDVLAGLVDPDLPLTHALEVTVEVVDEGGGQELVATWTWAPRVLRDDVVRRLAEAWDRALAGLVAWADDGRAAGATPSDFDLVSVDQDHIVMLERLLAANRKDQP